MPVQKTFTPKQHKVQLDGDNYLILQGISAKQFFSVKQTETGQTALLLSMMLVDDAGQPYLSPAEVESMPVDLVSQLSEQALTLLGLSDDAKKKQQSN